MNVAENTQMRDELTEGELAVVAGGMMNLPGRVSQMVTQPGTTTGSADPNSWGPFGVGVATLAFEFAVAVVL